MYVLPTTTISVLRGTVLDEFLDEADTTTVVATGVPASLIEQTRRPYTPDNPTPRVIRYSIARLSSDADIRESDRIKDESTNRIYIIEAVSSTTGFGMCNDLRLDLKQTT
ncbi:hypothetical protein OOK53_18940 [Streptomyces anulatus]|nr:hypothetical protein [Streptomyces anulatus]